MLDIFWFLCPAIFFPNFKHWTLNPKTLNTELQSTSNFVFYGNNLSNSSTKRLSLKKIKFMETIQIELKNKNALSILKSLEKANIIKMHTTNKPAKNSHLQLKGAISQARAIELANEIEKSRNEWNERTIWLILTLPFIISDWHCQKILKNSWIRF